MRKLLLVLLAVAAVTGCKGHIDGNATPSDAPTNVTVWHDNTHGTTCYFIYNTGISCVKDGQ